MTFEDVETARKNYQKKLQKGWLITLVATILVAAFSAVLFPVAGQFALFGIVFLAIFSFAVGTIIIALTTRKEATDYKKAYKAYFVAENLAKTFSKLRYSHEEGLPREVLRSSGMINTGDAYVSNDLTRGEYKNVKFAQADVTIQEEHEDSDGNTTYVIIFRGRVLLFEFPKKFTYRLELIGKRASSFARIPKSDKKSLHKMQKLTTESSEFHKHYRLIAEDGFEAYYLLDPRMLEKLTALAEHYKDRLLLGFTDSTLLVALNDGKDSFEPPKPGKPLDEAKEHEKIHSDISVITALVDELLR